LRKPWLVSLAQATSLFPTRPLLVVVFVAGALLALLGPPILILAWILGKHDLVYPVALFGAGAWLRLSE